jgi:hypothetical protein
MGRGVTLAPPRGRRRSIVKPADPVTRSRRNAAALVGISAAC